MYNMKIHFAPVQGHTDATYRRTHAACYGAADCYYTPFIRLERGAPRQRDMRDIAPEANEGIKLVPQLIFRDGTELLPLVEAVKDAGYDCADINMGCPFPLQTGHGRGAAVAGSEEAARLVAQVVRDNPDMRFSVKMRLGLNDRDEWRRTLPILNEVPLTHITMHPRVARQQYGGTVDMEAFDSFLSESENPVVYNGDLLTPEDVHRIAQRYPDIAGIMIARGLLGRPSMAAEIREGREWSREERVNRMLEFHRAMADAYESSLCGDSQILSKIKPFWEYAEDEIGRRPWKEIRKASNIAKYNSAVASISVSLDD